MLTWGLSLTQEPSEEAAPAEGDDEELDFGAMKKKKKKKKNMAEFEAELAEQEGENGEEKSEESAAKGDEEAWLKSDRDYNYEELLSRVFKILRQNNPELAGEKKRYTIVPPSIHREGNKKTIFANVADICKRYDKTNFLHMYCSICILTSVVKIAPTARTRHSILVRWIGYQWLCRRCPTSRHQG